jgi:uncharacterized protein YajQ (UPF0234 family)
MRFKNFKCEIVMENAAFDDDSNGTYELSRLLRVLADKIERRDNFVYVFDVNGNQVGTAKIYRKEVRN